MASSRTTIGLSNILFVWLALAQTGCQSSIGTQAQFAAASQSPATILIIRHAEKLPNGDTDLSAAGYERAQLLLKAFIPLGVRPDLPTPQFIFAAAPSPHSNRSALTVAPLADALHLQINQDFQDHKYDSLAAELLSGKVRRTRSSSSAGTTEKSPSSPSLSEPRHPTTPGPISNSTASGRSTTPRARRPYRTSLTKSRQQHPSSAEPP